MSRFFVWTSTKVVLLSLNQCEGRASLFTLVRRSRLFVWTSAKVGLLCLDQCEGRASLFVLAEQRTFALNFNSIRRRCAGSSGRAGRLQQTPTSGFSNSRRAFTGRPSIRPSVHSPVNVTKRLVEMFCFQLCAQLFSSLHSTVFCGATRSARGTYSKRKETKRKKKKKKEKGNRKTIIDGS